LKSIEFCREVLKEAQAKHVQETEVYMVSSTSTLIEIKDQKVDSFELAKDNGIGLRVIADGACGFSYSNDFSKKVIKNIIEKAISSAKNTTPDKKDFIMPLPVFLLNKYG